MDKKLVTFISLFIVFGLVLFTCIIAISSFALYNTYRTSKEEDEVRHKDMAIQLADDMLVPSGYVLEKRATFEKRNKTTTYVTEFKNGEEYIKIVQYPLSSIVEGGGTPVECDPTDVVLENGNRTTLTECNWLDFDVHYILTTNDRDLSEAKIRRMLDVKPTTENQNK